MDPSFLSAKDLQQLREILNLPTLEILIRPEWGSHHPLHRQAIKDSLNEKKSQSRQSSVSFASSTSHCPSGGGFAWLSQEGPPQLQLGFDIEESHRVRSELAQRICKNIHELTEAPSAASLWTAKEAAYKSLQGRSQPRTVSEIILVDWKIINSQIETVSLQLEKNLDFYRAHGVLVKKEAHTLALFVSFF